MVDLQWIQYLPTEKWRIFKHVDLSSPSRRSENILRLLKKCGNYGPEIHTLSADFWVLSGLTGCDVDGQVLDASVRHPLPQLRVTLKGRPGRQFGVHVEEVCSANVATCKCDELEI